MDYQTYFVTDDIIDVIDIDMETDIHSNDIDDIDMIDMGMEAEMDTEMYLPYHSDLHDLWLLAHVDTDAASAYLKLLNRKITNDTADSTRPEYRAARGKLINRQIRRTTRIFARQAINRITTIVCCLHFRSIRARAYRSPARPASATAGGDDGGDNAEGDGSDPDIRRFLALLKPESGHFHSSPRKGCAA
jgi:hypothetical protein